LVSSIEKLNAAEQNRSAVAENVQNQRALEKSHSDLATAAKKIVNYNYFIAKRSPVQN
jgi:hypothetical protein